MIRLNYQQTAVPLEHHHNFFHLYWDIIWFGVLSGSAISFMLIYAARLGAAGWQIGLLNAAPAVVSLTMTLPVGQWLQRRRSLSRAVFWTSVSHRLFYAPWLFLPLFFLPQSQVLALTILVFLMSIPGTALNVGFNTMFAAVVPSEWRAHVTGIRNGVFSGSFIATSLLCSWLLERLPFPQGYQVVFALGAVGAALSSLHLWFVRLPEEADAPEQIRRRRALTIWLRQVHTAFATLRFFIHRSLTTRPASNLSHHYRRVLLSLFLYHFAHYLAIPLFPLYWVSEISLTDQHIGWGNTVFYLTVLLTSMQIGRLVGQRSNRQLLLLGAIGMCLYPILTAVTHSLLFFLFVSAIGGINWGLVSGTLTNYVFEQIPDNQRPSHLAWYYLTFNAAVLVGSLTGPLLAAQVGLVTALILAGIGRLLAAIALWHLGSGTRGRADLTLKPLPSTASQ